MDIDENLFEVNDKQLFDTHHLSFNNYEKNNILNLIDKINKIAFSRKCKKEILPEDIKLCNIILHSDSNKSLPKHNLLDYNQKLILNRLISKNSTNKYSKKAFEEFCKLTQLYNELNMKGEKKISIPLKNPNSYVLGNQIGFLLNELNKKIYRLDNKDDNLVIQEMVNLRDLQNSPKLIDMKSVPLTYFSELDSLLGNNLKLGDNVEIKTNSNERHKCKYFDSIGNCINYCRMFKRA